MNEKMIVPTLSDYQSMNSKVDVASAAKCISSCRGCQCHVNTMSVEDIFSDMVAPVQAVYDKIVDAFKTNIAFTAGGCTCNCTACNSCRCDCSCRRYSLPEEEPDAIWA